MCIIEHAKNTRYNKLLCVADGIIGMAIVGGAAAVAIGGIVGLGIAISRRS